MPARYQTATGAQNTLLSALTHRLHSHNSNRASNRLSFQLSCEKAIKAGEKPPDYFTYIHNPLIEEYWKQFKDRDVFGEDIKSYQGLWIVWCNALRRIWDEEGVYEEVRKEWLKAVREVFGKDWLPDWTDRWD